MAGRKHFSDFGAAEGRTITFDALRYTASNTDLIKAFGTDQLAAARHYIQFGAAEGRGASFDAFAYLAVNADLRAAFGTNTALATRHFIEFGSAEGRGTAFDAFAYLAANADLRGAFGSDTALATRHYVEFGAGEGRKTAFDALSYIASHADLRAAFGVDTAAATRHYVQAGAAEGRAVTFDPLAYLASYADLRAAYGEDAAAAGRHYILIGANEGRTISFDAVAYLLSNADLGAAGLDARGALLHWLRNGAAEGRSASGTFGTEQVDHGLNLSSVASGRINQAGDRDWFRIDVAAGERIGVDLLLNGQRQGTIALYDANGRAVALNRTTLGQSAFTAAVTGTYYVVVAGVGAAMGDYDLLVSNGRTPLLGTAGSDTLTGSDIGEHIVGQAGNDTLAGNGGNDLLEGGVGNDRLLGGSGDDILYGDTRGNDVAGGDDTLIDTDGGNDRLYGQGGNDYLFVSHDNGAASEILLDGGAGNDTIYHSSSAFLADRVTVVGGSGNDTIQTGSAAAATIDAGSGDDLVRVNAGNALLTLGTGADVLEIDNAFVQSGLVTITDFRPGEDRINLDLLLAGRLVGWDQRSNPIAAGFISFVAQNGDTLVMIDRDGRNGPAYAAEPLLLLKGVSPASLLASDLGFSPDGGTTANVTLTGTAGQDRFYGLAGADVLRGLAGDDILDGRAGDDVLEGGSGYDRLKGGLGNDRLYGNNAANSGADGADSLRDVAGGNDELYGQDGDDSLYVYRVSGMLSSLVTLDGGNGNDTIEFDAQRIADNLIVRGGAGADRLLIGSAMNAQIDAGMGDDVVTLDTSSLSQTVTLGDGEDLLQFASRTGSYTIGNAIVVTDFKVGSDRVSLTGFLQNALSGWNGVTNPFTTGHVKLVQSGTDTLLQVDRDGTGTGAAFTTLVTFSNTSAGAFSVRELGYEPPAQTVQTITGTSGNDTLNGTDGADVVRGLEGSDTLNGRGGNDVLEGGSGYDQLNGGLGDDVLYGNNAANTGYDDYDYLTDDQGGNDRLYGQDGGDSLTVSRYSYNSSTTIPASTVLLDGGAGDDSIGFYSDRFLDTVTISGGTGNDTISVGSVKQAVVDAGEGNDKVTVGTSGGDQTITLGAGADTLTLNGSSYSFAVGNPLRVTDFATGTDTVALDQYLANVLVNWDRITNPFASGHLKLVQSGSDTLLQLDRDGAAGTGYGLSTLVTFSNTTATSFTARDLGFAPDGSSSGIGDASGFADGAMFHLDAVPHPMLVIA